MWLFFLILLSRPPLEEQTQEVKKHILKRGETLDGAIKSLGIPDTTALKLISCMRSVMDLRRCDIGDKIEITKSNGNFYELKYKRRKDTWIIDSLFQVSAVPIQSKYTYLHGVVERGVLWDGIINAGGSPKLVYDFADEIFAWDIDFNVETQSGDSFEIFTTAEYSGDRFIGYGRILYARYVSRRKEWTGVFWTKATPGYYNLEGKSLKKLFLRAPLAYQRISSGFTKRRLHPVLRKWMPHLGVDYVAPMGTPIRTVGDGVVTLAGWRRGFGKSVIIQHPGRWTSYYGHLSEITRGITKGKRVKQGDIIGKLGSTGLSTGPHLDFRLKHHAKWVNPIKVIPPPIEPLKGQKLAEYNNYIKELFLLKNAIRTLNKIPLIQSQ